MTVRVLCVGGLDPCGGAGITADARVAHALQAAAATVASCLTVQNRHGLRAAHAVDEAVLRAALDAVREDGPIDAVKTGMFAGADSVRAVARWLAELDPAPPLVVDPVGSATAGGWHPDAGVAAALREELVPRATVVTPNRAELADLGPPGRVAVLATDGDGDGDLAVDRLLCAGIERTFSHHRLRRGPVHGTGCALATALAIGLGRGADLEAACAAAIDFVASCLRATPESGDGLPTPLTVP